MKIHKAFESNPKLENEKDKKTLDVAPDACQSYTKNQLVLRIIIIFLRVPYAIKILLLHYFNLFVS